MNNKEYSKIIEKKRKDTMMSKLIRIKLLINNKSNQNLLNWIIITYHSMYKIDLQYPTTNGYQNKFKNGKKLYLSECFRVQFHSFRFPVPYCHHIIRSSTYGSHFVTIFIECYASVSFISTASEDIQYLNICRTIS